MSLYDNSDIVIIHESEDANSEKSNHIEAIVDVSSSKLNDSSSESIDPNIYSE